MFARASTARRKLLNAVVIILPISFGVGCYGVHRWASDLEARYPPLSPADAKAISTTLLRTPCNPATQRCAYVDIYSARVPLRILLQEQQHQHQRQRQNGRGGRAAVHKAKLADGTKGNLHITWAKAFLRSRIMAAEAPYFDIPIVTDDGNDNGSIKYLSVPSGKDVFEHGSLAFVTEQTKDTSLDQRDKLVEGVLFCWHMPDPPRKFFETISPWGYPWRLMSGGRHELSVSPAFIPDDQGQDREHQHEHMVELRFASAHDYEIVPAEGPEEKQKILPAWTLRLHRAYARFLLDMAVKEMMQRCERSSD